jgi:mannose/fructose/N-acetylgalactosamine-specific phosphotransferase system component IIC
MGFVMTIIGGLCLVALAVCGVIFIAEHLLGKRSQQVVYDYRKQHQSNEKLLSVLMEIKTNLQSKTTNPTKENAE